MRHMRLLVPFLSFLAAATTVAGQDRVTYRVDYGVPGSPRIHVTISPPTPLNGPVNLVFPRAIPGGYTQKFYDRYVESMQAVSSIGAPLKIDRLEGPRWRIADPATDLARITYEIDLARMEREIPQASDASKVRLEYLGLLGYSALAYIEGFEDAPVRLEINAPPSWPVFTTLAPRAPPESGKLISADAPNFYALADSQIAMGPKLIVRRFDAPVPFFLIVYAEVETDLDQTGALATDALRKVMAYFGGAPPFTCYTAYIEILKPLTDRHEYGFSMEHLNSSTYFLGADRAITPITPPAELERDRFNFAHHIAHSWIPKKLYSTGYLPFTWELAPVIETIWFNEGFGRYVAIEALADAMPEEQAREYRRRQLDRLQRIVDGMPATIRNMPLVELSRVGSLLYSEDFRTGQTLFSKGALMAAEMDAHIRQRTAGTKRLRDSLRAMMRWSEKSQRAFRIEELPGLIALPVGLDEREIREIMNRWLGQAGR